MRFHDICMFEKSTASFWNFEKEMVGLPGFDRYDGKLYFVELPKFKGMTEDDREQEYELKSFKVDGKDLSDSIKSLLGSFVDSRESFFRIVRFVLDSTMHNGLFYLWGFSIKTIIDVPDGVDFNTLKPEEIAKLPHRPIFIIRACEKKKTIVEPKQEVVKTEETK